MAKCRGCGRPIRFVSQSTEGRPPIPVDAAPDEDGRVAARTVADRLVGRALARGEDAPAGWLRFMPHQATCEIATRGRRQKRRPEPPLTLFDTNEGEPS